MGLNPKVIDLYTALDLPPRIIPVLNLEWGQVSPEILAELRVLMADSS
jgi:hypothetical protein